MLQTCYTPIGTLLIGELLTNLWSKPLDKATIHSLIGFFMDRLVSWLVFGLVSK